MHSSQYCLYTYFALGSDTTATDGESLYATMRTGPIASRLPSKAGAMFAGVKRRRATQRVRYVVHIAQPIKLIYDHHSNLFLSFFISSDDHTDLGFRHSPSNLGEAHSRGKVFALHGRECLREDVGRHFLGRAVG